MSPQEFWDACDKHDWFYDFSDDAAVWRRGREREGALMSAAPTGSEQRKIFTQFKEHYFSGSSFNKPKVDKPPRPE